jgi:hypothetical protein
MLLLAWLWKYGKAAVHYIHKALITKNLLGARLSEEEAMHKYELCPKNTLRK